jgi:glutathione-specific gamma-glutamylcyclotransferase
MQEPLWVFGYGSLIWDPGFPIAERRIARATGWHRSFCMRSIHFRGTATDPGLVLALDRAEGATCTGVALRVAPGEEAATLFALRERELVSSAYLEMTLSVETEAGPLDALTYVIDPDHAQYCGGLDREVQARIIARASGGRGANRDYLWATAAHLADLGIADPELEWLAARVRAIT